MEGVGSEVSQKIRAAIKAKLIELGAYVDDELPDYIMVMVANKRSRSQMEDDLSLFLNNNTKIFTTWLHSVLKKLQEVTVAANNSKSQDRSKRKRSSSRESVSKGSKSSFKSKEKKKHSKKHKEKKLKKKHKNKDNDKKKDKRSASTKSDSDEEVPKKKIIKSEKMDVNKELGKAILGDIKDRQKLVGDDGTKEPAPCVENKVEGNNDSPNTDKDWEAPVVEYPEKSLTKNAVEPEKPIDTVMEEEPEVDLLVGNDVVEEVVVEKETAHTETTVLVPTKELLREHDKLTSLAQDALDVGIIVETNNKVGAKHSVASEESVNPDEIRRELLLSHAKRKLEQRGLERRMRSDSPEVMIIEEKGPASSKADRVPVENAPEKTIPVTHLRRSSSKSSQLHRQADESPSSGRLSLGTRSTRSSQSSHNKEYPSKIERKNIASCIVTPLEPEPPDIPSVVKVKPRDFVPGDKQANKNLILKAVAAAERSVATAPVRNLNTDEGRKPKALFTKDLREKRFESLEVTLTNDRSSLTGKIKRSKPFVDEKKANDVDDSSDTHLRKELVEGTEEHFISSKASSKDANTSFIRCWLEGVERAVECDDLINPDEIESQDQPDGVESTTEDGVAASQNAVQESRIQVTVDGLVTKRGTNDRTFSKPISTKVSLNVNRISDRFARISQPSEEHEYKDKYKEFERQRQEKKLVGVGETKNKRLIAELSQKFGQLDREFEEKKDYSRSSNVDEKTRSKSSRLPVDSKKSKEQCRFWPDCSRGALCEYYHPSATCKMLPACKFKEKCIYKHPLCKKDLNCTSRDCAYTHSRSRRKKLPETTRGQNKYDKYISTSDAHSSRITCRYGSRCRNRDCAFTHPRDISPKH